MEGKLYGDLAKKKAAVEQVLQLLASDPEKVKRLTRWDWIQDAVDRLFTEETAFHRQLVLLTPPEKHTFMHRDPLR